ncbi:hypothetical protein WICPIJ_008132 [Wickerhamomyces pijperi]|uniref:Dolichyl-diphosphooligosaccharide--protein glycosyltransferase subunit OST6 n=1 Tax=Wickerhamomyces pijperi TaxID=599730 RepID=A0A9P8TJA8_WICPI|nr:hypothetical protein WICPIJ_008132 [Wickerhamomyces pijperi]
MITLQYLLWCFVTLLSFVQGAINVEEVIQLQDDNHMIYLNPGNIDSIINGIRPYYVAVLFTTSDQGLNCGTCDKFLPSYHKAAAAVNALEKYQNLIMFTIAEVHDNKEVFRQLNLNSVPKVRLYPPSPNVTTTLASEFYEYAVTEASFDPLHFANAISKMLAISIVVPQDFDITEFSSYFLITFAVIIIFKKLVISKAPKYKLLQLFSVAAVLMFVSGYMFTVIRGIPFISRDENGEIMYFSGGTHWQFGSETFIIASIYAGLLICVVLLAVTIPAIADDTFKRDLLTIIVTGLLFYIICYHNGIYMIKDPDYPYKLLSV